VGATEVAGPVAGGPRGRSQRERPDVLRAGPGRTPGPTVDPGRDDGAVGVHGRQVYREGARKTVRIRTSGRGTMANGRKSRRPELSAESAGGRSGGPSPPHLAARGRR